MGLHSGRAFFWIRCVSFQELETGIKWNEVGILYCNGIKMNQAFLLHSFYMLSRSQIRQSSKCIHGDPTQISGLQSPAWLQFPSDDITFSPPWPSLGFKGWRINLFSCRRISCHRLQNLSNSSVFDFAKARSPKSIEIRENLKPKRRPWLRARFFASAT